MRIGLVRYRGLTKSFEDREGGAWGCGSLAWLCDKPAIYSHHEAVGVKLDFAMVIGGINELTWLSEYGKPRKWGKIIYIPCRGGWEINNPDIIFRILDIGFDAFIVPPGDTWQMYEIFKKPIISICYPYNFYSRNDKQCRRVSKKNKVVLYIKNLRDVKTNFLSTLEVFRRLNVPGIVTTNPATPYKEDVGVLRSIVNRFGLSDRLEVIDPMPRNDYLRAIADCKVMIDMDFRNVWGRTVIDAVTCGMYCVGSYSYYQKMFFPELIISSFNVNECYYNVYACLCMNDYKPDFHDNIFVDKNGRKNLEKELRCLY